MIICLSYRFGLKSVKVRSAALKKQHFFALHNSRKLFPLSEKVPLCDILFYYCRYYYYKNTINLLRIIYYNNSVLEIQPLFSTAPGLQFLLSKKGPAFLQAPVPSKKALRFKYYGSLYFFTANTPAHQKRPESGSSTLHNIMIYCTYIWTCW